MSELRERLAAALGERYAIDREIGRGGMATVFLAEERHPRRRVAIKVLNPEVASSLIRDRFLQEIEFASNLAHPHIAPVFTAGNANGLLYYVMPYIEGESLRDRLNAKGPLELELAVDVALEIASALQYAHSRGVVHRDIKPENIMLVDDHAMVFDFGVARAVGAARDEGLTQPGIALGTPKYMSSEQWSASQDVDGRTDIYSLGCVLLEMLEGRLPEGADPASRLRTEPALAGATITSSPVPRELRPVLRRALAADRADRFATAGDFAAAIERAMGRSVQRRHRVRTWVFRGVALALVIFTAGIWFRPQPAAPTETPRVVVALFENQTGDSSLASLSTIATDWVTRGLAETGLVNVVSTEGSMAASSVTPPMASADERARALAARHRAGIVVWGDYFREGDTLRFEAQIADARTGTILRALDPIAGPAEAPLSTVETLRQRVMGAMATLFDQRFSAWADVTSQPPTFEAYEDYIEGLRRIMQIRPEEGLPYLYRAAEQDSTFAAPVLMAAFANAALARWSATDSLTQIVGRRRERLTPFNRLLLDWMLALLGGDIPEQLDYARDMVELAPGAESLTLAATTALAANRPTEALDALARLDSSEGMLSGYSRYWLLLTSGLHLTGQHVRELEAARRGRAQYPYQPSMIEQEMRALAALGRAAALDSVTTLLMAMPVETRWSEGVTLLRAALELRAHGYESAVDPMLQEAVEWYRDLPPVESARQAHRYGLARALYVQGDLDGALQLATELSRQEPDSAAYLGLLGVVHAKRGDAPAAQRVIQRLDSLHGRYLFGEQRLWQARIEAALGDEELALSFLAQSFRDGRAFDLDLHIDPDLSTLRDLPGYRAFVRPQGSPPKGPS